MPVSGAQVPYCNHIQDRFQYFAGITHRLLLLPPDIVIVPAGIIEEAKGKIRPYTEHLRKKAEADFIPSAPKCEFYEWYDNYLC